MPIATTSSGRALYEHASTAFVHNMPLEALSTIGKAIHTGQAHDTQQLAEQFVILRVTALCAIYSPNDPQEIATRWQNLSQANPRADEQETTAVRQQLQLEPSLFLTSLWTQVLQFYATAPVIPSIPIQLPSEGQKVIMPEPASLLSALQLPASVLEALVLGALKIDEDIVRMSLEPTKRQSNGTTTKKEKASKPGVQAARAICEWLLSAHSALTSTQVELNEVDQVHLYEQHSRVLRLYALEVLGARQNEWEYAGEMVRCAKLLTSGQAEIEERSALLSEIIQAQATAGSRVERLQAAKERAKRIMSDQLEKKKQDAAKAQNVKPPVRSNNVVTSPPITSKPSVKQSSIDSHKTTSTKEPGRASEVAKVDEGRSIQPPVSVGGRERKTDSNGAVSTGTPTDSSVLPVSTMSSLRSMFNALLRNFGGATGFVLALIAVLITVRRGVKLLRGRASLSRTSNRPQRSQISPAMHSTPAPASQGLIASAWQKIANTIKM